MTTAVSASAMPSSAARVARQTVFGHAPGETVEVWILENASC
jgi:hypothetical protein